jgi:hypothetical protein
MSKTGLILVDASALEPGRTGLSVRHVALGEHGGAVEAGGRYRGRMAQPGRFGFRNRASERTAGAGGRCLVIGEDLSRVAAAHSRAEHYHDGHSGREDSSRLPGHPDRPTGIKAGLGAYWITPANFRTADASMVGH